MEHSEGLLGRMATFYLIGDYKAVCLIVLHQAIHLFFTDVLFCNKRFSFNSRLQRHLNISTPNKGLVFLLFSSLMQRKQKVKKRSQWPSFPPYLLPLLGEPHNITFWAKAIHHLEFGILRDYRYPNPFLSQSYPKLLEPKIEELELILSSSFPTSSLLVSPSFLTPKYNLNSSTFLHLH